MIHKYISNVYLISYLRYIITFRRNMIRNSIQVYIRFKKVIFKNNIILYNVKFH